MKGVYLEDSKKRTQLLKKLDSLEEFFEELSAILGYDVTSLYRNLSYILNSEEKIIRPYFIIAHLVREVLYSMSYDAGKNYYLKRTYKGVLMRPVPQKNIDSLEKNPNDGIKFEPDGKTFTISLKTADGQYIQKLCHGYGFERPDWRGEIREFKAQADALAKVDRFSIFLKKHFKLKGNKLETTSNKLKNLHSLLNDYAHLYKTQGGVVENDFYDSIFGVIEILRNLDSEGRSTVSLNKQLSSLAKGEVMISKKNVAKVKNILDNSSLYQRRLFFSEINSNWLIPLLENGFFEKIPVLKEGSIARNLCWPEGDYILRILSDDNIETIKGILGKIQTQDIYNPEARHIYLEIVVEILKKDPSAQHLLDRVLEEKWVSKGQLWTLGYYPIQEIITLIVDGMEYEKFVDLIGEIFDTNIQTSEIKNDYNSSNEESPNPKEMKQKIVVNMNDPYLTTEILKKLSFWNGDVIVLQKLLTILSVYIQQKKIIEKEDINEQTDFSWLEWQDLSNGKDEMYWGYEDALIFAIRSMVDTYVKEKQTLNVEELFSDVVIDYDLLSRFKLYIIVRQLYLYDSEYLDSIVKEYLWRRGTFREFLFFMHDAYKKLSKKRQKWFVTEVENKLSDERLKYFAGYLLLSIRDFLPKEFINRYPDLFNNHPEWYPEVHKMEVKELLDVPPFALEQIKEKTLNETLSEINNFKEEPYAEFNNKPTVRSFAKLLKEDFTINPVKYMGSFDKILDCENGLVFVHLIYTGIRDIDIENFDWEILFKELLSILRRIFQETETFDKRELNGFLFDLVNAIEHKIENIPNHNQGIIFLILKEILENNSDEDPIILEQDLDYYSKAISTVEGTIYNILMWMLTVEKDSMIDDQIIEYLETKLDDSDDTMFYCMLGFYYAFISSKYENIANRIKQHGFFSENTNIFRATWDGYLARNTVYSDIFKNNIDIYQFAIDNKANFTTKKSYGVESVERLLEHFSLAFLYPNFGEDAINLFNTVFFEKTSLYEKKYILDFLGRKVSFKKDDENLAVQRILDFWALLLKRKDIDIKLLESLGGWVSPQGFKGRELELINLLLETLNRTNGVLQGSYRLVEKLKDFIGFDNIKLLECLHLLVGSIQDQFILLPRDQATLEKMLSDLQKSGKEEALKVLEIRETLVEKGFDKFGG